MKKLLLSAAILALAGGVSFAFNDMGHATVAALAEKHLSRSAAKAINEYLGKNTMVLHASDADYCRAIWTLDLGFTPSNLSASQPAWIVEFDRKQPGNISVYAHMFTVDENLNPYKDSNLNGKYIQNAVWEIAMLAEDLKKNAKTMDPETRRRELLLLIHLVGDIHCPSHITYGAFTSQPKEITVAGYKTKFHDFWDASPELGASWSSRDLAAELDTASKDEIKAISAGTPYDWGKDSAKSCFKVNQTKTGDFFHKSTFVEFRDFSFDQIRKAGYRLAAILNDIF